MGTRSLTFVYENDTPIVCMYRQFDGYPEGHGIELAEFLNDGKIVNGISRRDEKVFNGMGCLAAQMISNFKKEAGGFYLHAPILGRDDWQEYEYHVFEDKVVVKCPHEVIFSGTWSQFYNFCYDTVTE
jgi:hypothetical protein